MVLKFRITTDGFSVCRYVSVPLRGCGFEMIIEDMIDRLDNIVSVPLRGCGFEIPTLVDLFDAWNEKVSVPLRGCGFEMITGLGYPLQFHEFPSPCGDVVLK